MYQEKKWYTDAFGNAARGWDCQWNTHSLGWAKLGQVVNTVLVLVLEGAQPHVTPAKPGRELEATQEGRSRPIQGR